MIAKRGQYITFKLGGELFAVNVAQVREVRELSRITRVPTAPEYVRGVMNVRGKAIPAVDLRLRFGLPASTDTVHTRVIVMELLVGGETTLAGGLADSVTDVIALDSSAISAPPRTAMRWRAEFIDGLVSHGDEFIVILDANAVFTGDEPAQENQTMTEEHVARLA